MSERDTWISSAKDTMPDAGMWDAKGIMPAAHRIGCLTCNMMPTHCRPQARRCLEVTMPGRTERMGMNVLALRAVRCIYLATNGLQLSGSLCAGGGKEKFF